MKNSFIAEISLRKIKTPIKDPLTIYDHINLRIRERREIYR